MALEWLKTNLGAVADWSSGSTPSKARADYWHGDVPWVSPKDMKRFELDDAEDHLSQAAIDQGVKLAPPGTVFIVVRGMILAHTFPVCIAGRSMSFNQDVKALVPRTGTDGRFLAHWLRGRTDRLLRLVTEATHGTKRIDLRDIQATPIDLPELLEQRRIVEILDAIDEAIYKTEQIIAKLKQVKHGLLHDLLTCGIDDNGALRDPIRHPEQFKDSEIGRVPRAWEIAPFRGYGASERPYLKTGPFGSSLKQEHWVEQGVPVITIGALGEGEFIRSELLHVSESTARQLAAYRVRQGDIVFSRVADVGRSVVVHDQEEAWLMSSNLMWIALDQRRALPAFVQANIAANPSVRSQIRRFVNAGGREVANATVLNSLVLPWPNIVEQRQIAALLANASVRLTREEEELAKLQLLNQGLADDLLTGRVRVPEDRFASRRSDPPRDQLGLEL